jgi:DNA-binding NtrC family response regulator
MPTSADADHLLLIGAPGPVLDLAAGLSRTPRTVMSVGWSAPDLLRIYRRRRRNLVAIDMTLDLPEVLARLCGQRRMARVEPAAADPLDALVGRTIAEVERDLILHTLARCRGNRTSAAAMLGISVRTMRNKLRSFLQDSEPTPVGAGA